MAFKTLRPKREPVTLAALGERIARRSARWTSPATRKRRTPSKRALLKAIDEAGGKW